MLPFWKFGNLSKQAVGRSISRRTDVPALYGDWLMWRMEEGWAEYEPAGPPRRIRCSLRPEDITHFNFWSKWPRPFFPHLARLLDANYPVLWNVTITGFGATAVEPGVPPADNAVRADRSCSDGSARQQSSGATIRSSFPPPIRRNPTSVRSAASPANWRATSIG